LKNLKTYGYPDLAKEGRYIKSKFGLKRRLKEIQALKIILEKQGGGKK